MKYPYYDETMVKNPDIIEILKDLVSFKSISPNDAGAIVYCENFLKKLGFKCKKLKIQGVNNLYAKLGHNIKNLCFAGHIDVVPPLEGWNTDPFQLTVTHDDSSPIAYGRGVNDMKGPLSSCLAAIQQVITENSFPEDISLSVLLTSDEEIMGDYGTKAMVDYLLQIGEKITACVLCESCSPLPFTSSGEYIKVGCKGSLNVDVSSIGKQIHVANGPTMGNHLHQFIEKINNICNYQLDGGTNEFDPSSIQLTSIDSGNNRVRNIVPSEVTALFNIRFNNKWTFESLEKFILESFSGYEVKFKRFGSPFIGSSPKFVHYLSEVIEKTIEKKSDIGTKGGNSDALFIKNITDVVEIGSPVCNAHIVNEFIKLEDLYKLYNIYKNIILSFNC